MITEEQENCEHDFRYLKAEDGRAKRICAICGLRESSGWNDKDKWFYSYFATGFDGYPQPTDAQRIAVWSKEEIKLPL